MGLPRLTKIGAPDEGPKLALRWVGPYWLSNGVPHIGSEMGAPQIDILMGCSILAPRRGLLYWLQDGAPQIGFLMGAPDRLPNVAPQIGFQMGHP